MGVLSTLRGRMQSRTLALYRADPTVIARHLPAHMAVAPFRGRALVGVCYTRMLEGRPGLLPLSMGNDHLAWRFPVEVTGTDGRGRTAVWIPRRCTSSWFGAHCAGRLTRGNWGLADFRFEEQPGGLELAVTRGGEVEFELTASTASELRGSLFLNAAEARDVISGAGRSHPPFALAPGFDHLTLEPELWRIEPLEVHRVHARLFEEESLFPSGSVEFDCALRLTVTASTPLGEPEPEPVRPGSSPVVPAN